PRRLCGGAHAQVLRMRGPPTRVKASLGEEPALACPLGDALLHDDEALAQARGLALARLLRAVLGILGKCERYLVVGEAALDAQHQEHAVLLRELVAEAGEGSLPLRAPLGTGLRPRGSDHLGDLGDGNAALDVAPTAAAEADDLASGDYMRPGPQRAAPLE